MSTLTTPKKDGRRVPTEPAALAKFPKSRCKNCPKFFPKTRPNREFCSEDCKNEYNRNGSAFGPLRERLTKLIERRTKEETAARFEDAYKATALLLAGDASFIRALRAHGFIHRSDLKKPPLENTGAALRGSLDTQARLMQELEARLVHVERETGTRITNPAPR